MKTYTRKEMSYLLGMSEFSIERYCRGWYTTRGETFYFYDDRHRVLPIAGEGTKKHPFRYQLLDFKKYILGLQQKKWK